MTHLGTMVWPDLWAAAPRPLLVVPIGSCEQHGPHLPLDTDSRIAVALADGLVAAFADDSDTERARATMVVTPTLTISASGEHSGFPGTLSLGIDVFERVVVELVRSADWSGGVVLVNGHGGNAVAVQRAVSTLTLEGRRVLSWWPRDPGGDAHAGITETSLMLAIAPELVRVAAAQPGRTTPLRDLADDLRSGGVVAVSPNGVLGDPAGASAAHGRALLTRWRIDLIAAVDEWWI
ncbi:MAG: mycofactocin system creatininase family protein [Ilumatobacteraceae bacterium]|nr:mycofactocin system creatininase family protein [Ilumatobacteraceae bacterium]